MRTATNVRDPVPLLTVLFIVSGAAGLLYQVAWQRVLFASFGTDSESVALIVSAFMLGLGIGALTGGWLADRYPGREWTFFALCEVGIGLYGLVSVTLLRAAGDHFVDSSLAIVALVNFCLVLPPTALMGATLPILISGVTRRWGHVGQATGHLYSANTLGAAAGALASGWLVFQHLQLPTAVSVTAATNLSIAALVLLKTRSMR